MTTVEKIKAFADYYRCEENSQYNNVFEELNVGENSISQLLVWLLDTKWVNEEKYDVMENQLHREFTFRFLKLIKDKEKQNDKSVLQKMDESQLKNFARGILAIQDKNNIDILLENKDENFVCVIENKKRAKLSVSHSNKTNKRTLQIEKYYNYINTAYNNYDKKLIYICAEIEDTEKKISERLSDVGTVPLFIQENLIFKGLKYEEFKDKSVSWALSKLGYTIIEHSDIVLILHNILCDLCPKAFDNNKILKAVSKDSMNEMATSLLSFFNKEYELGQTISGNAKLCFYEKLSNEFSYEQRLLLLCQYVEYWELHNNIGNLQDNLSGYSKIINGEYIINVCKKIKENPNEWLEVEKMAEQSPRLKELIAHI